MNSFKFSLSINGYKNINFASLPCDFTFVVNEASYATNRIVADFISPIISKIHFSDPTFSMYNITLQNSGDFNDIINLGQLKEIEISTKNLEFIKESFKKLGNFDFYDNFESYYDQNTNEDAEYPDTYDFVEKLSIKEKLGSTNFNHEINYISHHFYEIDDNIEIVSKLEPFLLEEILQNEELCITSEDSLLLLLISLGEDYYHLFEYVYFQEISKICYLKFLSIFNLDFLNKSIWKSINNRIINLIQPDDWKNDFDDNEKRYKKKNEVILNFDFNNDFNGIISHLVQIGQGNPYKKKIMNVTSSSVYFDHYPHFCFDTFENTYFASEDKENQWILFDFKQNEIIPTYYLLRSQFDYINNLKSWMIEGSVDGINWTLLDKRLENYSLKSKNVTEKFLIQKPMRCKFIRLTQLGLNWNNNNFLIISGIEFFGKLISVEN